MDMKDEDIKLIEEELDKILEKFGDERFNAQNFINYSRTLYQSYFNNIGLHRKSRECVFPNCSAQSIKKSHSIPKTSSLLNIVSNGHLLKPEFDLTSDIPLIKMQRIGIKNASAFPGYCEEHENIFQTLEIDGEINDEKKALLQTYRTICRERVFREIEIDINERVKSAYCEKINEEALKSIKESLSQHSQFNNVNSIEIRGVDSVINSLEGINTYLSDTNKCLLEFENKIYQHVYNKPIKNELLISVINIDIKFPISLCGFATQKYNENGDEKIAYILLNVMPLKESTYIVCVGFERDEKIYEGYCDFFFSDPFNILNMVESFMINGSDHWFINPEYWEKIPIQKQEKILHDILTTEDSFLDEYQISIFDDIRIKIISFFKENTKKRELTDVEKDRIDTEMQKILRNDYEIIRDDDKFIDRILKKIKH
jgi:hypothetical protein